MNMFRQKGYVALLGVLIVGAASTAIALALLITGIDSQRSALVLLRSVKARNLATACAEEALRLIQEDTSFASNGGLTLGQGNCTYAVSNTGGATRTITVAGTVDNVVRKAQVYVTIGASSISVTSWQEVS